MPIVLPSQRIVFEKLQKQKRFFYASMLACLYMLVKHSTLLGSSVRENCQFTENLFRVMPSNFDTRKRKPLGAAKLIRRYWSCRDTPRSGLKIADQGTYSVNIRTHLYTVLPPMQYLLSFDREKKFRTGFIYKILSLIIIL